jgi:hypothetical protein
MTVKVTKPAINLREKLSELESNNKDEARIGSLESDSIDVGTLEVDTISSDVAVSGDINFGDNDKAIFGAGSDLQIYHTGYDSLIDDVGDGRLKIRSNGLGVDLQSTTGEVMLRALTDSSVSLYYDNSAKLATTSTGIDVTGTATMDGLTVDTTASNGVTINASDNLTTNYPLKVQNASGSGRLELSTYGINNNIDLKLQTQGTNAIYIDTNKDISFYEDTGTTAKFFWDASVESLGIGTTDIDTWSPYWHALQVGTGSSLVGASGVTSRTFLSDNAYNNGSNQSTSWKYSSTNEASQYTQLDGTHVFRTASSGTADTAITWTDAVTINNSGKVGIGTSSPTSNLEIHDRTDKTMTATAAGQLEIQGDGYGFGIALGADGAALYNNSSSRALMFGTNETERMRIDGSGTLLVGTTSYPYTAGNSGVMIYDASDWYGRINLGKSLSGSVWGLRCYHNGSGVGGIMYGDTSTSFNTSSDYRLKEDWQPVANASDRVAQLKPVNFAWKASGERVDGFLAHELAEVIPEAVTGTKDAMRTEEYEVSPAVLDDEGNVVTEAVMDTREVPDYQGIDQSKLVPLLTAALQEALTEIDNLKARLDAAGL